MMTYTYTRDIFSDMKPPYLDATFLRSRSGTCFTFWLLLVKFEIAWSRGIAGRKFPDFVSDAGPVSFPAGRRFPDFVSNVDPVSLPAEKSSRHVCSQKYQTEAETDYLV
jgi:hypothetical protein